MKYNDLRKKMGAAIFTLQDIRLLGGKVFPYQLSLWQRQGLLVKLRNGLYLFEERANIVSPEEIAEKLYSPSYISLEKALSTYGIIPEIISGITSATPKTTRTFKNRLGNFTYRHIKPALFTGYKEIKEGRHRFLMAEPEKALLDFLYLNLDRIKDKQDIEEFRFNLQTIRQDLSEEKIKRYLGLFKEEKMNKTMKTILGET